MFGDKRFFGMFTLLTLIGVFSGCGSWMGNPFDTDNPPQEGNASVVFKGVVVPDQPLVFNPLNGAPGNPMQQMALGSPFMSFCFESVQLFSVTENSNGEEVESLVHEVSLSSLELKTTDSSQDVAAFDLKSYTVERVRMPVSTGCIMEFVSRAVHSGIEFGIHTSDLSVRYDLDKDPSQDAPAEGEPVFYHLSVQPLIDRIYSIGKASDLEVLIKNQPGVLVIAPEHPIDHIDNREKVEAPGATPFDVHQQ